MSKTTLRDKNGLSIGTLTAEGSKTVARNFAGQQLGSYDSKTNKTTTFSGRLVGTGNQTGSLFKK